MFRRNSQQSETVAPHLPKEVRQQGAGEMAKEKWFLRLFILAVVFGFVSGIVGGMVVNSRFFDDWFWGEGGIWKANTGVTRPESKNLNRDSLTSKTLAMLVDFFPLAAVGKDGLIDPAQKIGSGFFLTANGYLASSRTLWERYGRKEVVAVTAEKRIYRLEKLLFDPFSELAIGQVQGEGFSSLSFAFEEDIRGGSEAYLPVSRAGLAKSEVVAAAYLPLRSRADYYFSSERVYRFGLLKNQFDKKSVGAPLVNASGEVIGMLSGTGANSSDYTLFLKADVISSALRQALKTGAIQRVFLGLNFQEGGEKAILPKEENRRGAVLSFNPRDSSPALSPKSPLLPLGLKNGDIILGIGEEVISPSCSLPELLLDYQPGEEIAVKYLKNGEEKITKVKLSAL